MQIFVPFCLIYFYILSKRQFYDCLYYIIMYAKRSGYLTINFNVDDFKEL